MDSFDRNQYYGSYYSVVKNFTSVIGRWSFQSLKERLFFTTFFVSIWLFQVIGEASAVIVNFDNKESILESIPPLITDTIGATKYINNIINSYLIKDLFDRIKESWYVYMGKAEQSILDSYAKQTKIYSIGYVGLCIAGLGFTSTSMFILEPLLPRLWCFLTNMNETIPIEYATPVYWYGFDIEKDYYLLVIFSNMGLAFVLLGNMTMDVLFITLMQHAVGLFAITGYMMEHVPTQKDLDHEANVENCSILQFKKMQYKHYVDCIKSHTQAIKFADDLEAVYVWCLGIIITLNVIMLSVTATQIATQATTLEQLIKFGIFAFAQFLHIFIFCFFSQKLMTISENVQEYICNGLWYECTPETQKLLVLVTQRSQLPCYLTAGKIALLSMETFTVIVKTSASYFTVLMSMQ